MSSISPQNPIAFFCAEFGLESRLPIYAGGLGVLAGDILRESSTQHLPMVGIGLLYRGEGAIQRITSEGKQQEEDLNYDPLAVGLEHVYVDEMPLFIKVHLTELDVWVRCWKKTLSESVTLYLLDPDTEQNHRHERGIAHALYAGTEEELIKQQLILGIGGIKLLHALGIYPSLYHINEGRPAFLHWQLIRGYMDEHGMEYEKAAELAKSKTVYTNHTLVEAGNQSYTTHLLRAYGLYYAQKMGITIDELLQPGIEAGSDRFSITRYALNTSRKASAVSQLHYSFCQQEWPEYDWIGVTNGVHLPFWQDARISDSSLDSGDDEVWRRHLECKQELMQFVQGRTGFGYDPNRLIISWARRIAGYKHLDVLFSDIQRLQKLVKDAQMPIHILIAGKAHIFDQAAKLQIEEAIKYMQEELAGFALFVPNLDIDLDQMLVKGSDVWLNTPEFGKEACGTSGMKALSNGVLQCTVPDGWAHEVDWSGMGWVLDKDNVAESFYTQLENEIQPMFYDRNTVGVPERWVERMKKSVQTATQFSARRMMAEYSDQLYR